MIGMESVICHTCSCVMEKQRQVSVLDREGPNYLIWLGYKYTCNQCGHTVVSLVSGSPIMEGDVKYDIIRNNKADYEVN